MTTESLLSPSIELSSYSTAVKPNEQPRSSRFTTAVAMTTVTGSATAISFLAAASGETKKSSLDGALDTGGSVTPVTAITPVTALLLLYSRKAALNLSSLARSSGRSTDLLQHRVLSVPLRHSGPP